MDLDQLRYFLAVVKFLNFTKASDYLRISQSTLSRRIKALEQNLGVKLMIRNNRCVVLTQAGEALLAESVRLMASWDDICEHVAKQASGELGSLSIASICVDCKPLFRAYNRFCREHENVVFIVKDVYIGDIWEHLLVGKEDVGIVFSYMLPENISGFCCRTIQTDRFCLLVSEEHAFTELPEKKVLFKDLRTENILGLRQINYAQNFFCGDINNVKRVADIKRFFPKTSLQPDDLHTLILQVRAGIGIALLPRSVAKVYTAGCELVDIMDLTSEFNIVMVYRQDNQARTIQIFEEILADELQRAKPTSFA